MALAYGLSLLPLIPDTILAAYLQKYALENEYKNNILVGTCGSVGVALYAIYHTLFFSNKRCLARVLNAYKKSPQDFPVAAHEILNNPRLKHFDSNLIVLEQNDSEPKMTYKEITKVCTQLRTLEIAA